MSLLPSSFSPSMKQQTLFLHPPWCALRSIPTPNCWSCLQRGPDSWGLWRLQMMDPIELSSWGAPKSWGFPLAPVSPVTRSLFMCISLQRQMQYLSDGFPLRFLNWWPHAIGGIAVLLGTFWCVIAVITLMSRFRCWTDTRDVQLLGELIHVLYKGKSRTYCRGRSWRKQMSHVCQMKAEGSDDIAGDIADCGGSSHCRTTRATLVKMEKHRLEGCWVWGTSHCFFHKSQLCWASVFSSK